MNPNPLTRRQILTGMTATVATISAANLATALQAQSQPTDREKSVVLITGCSSGFGRLMALTFARNGYQVFASMRNLATRNAQAAQELADIAKRENLTLETVEIDVNSRRSVDRGVDQVLNKANRIDIAINNAGITAPAPLEMQSIDYASSVFQTNVFGALRINRAVLPQMRDRRNGLIIQITSGLGRLLTIPGISAYCGTKAALDSMMEALSYELSPFGVELAIVQPGQYPTQFQANARRQLQEYQQQLSPADRIRESAYAEHLKRIQSDLQESSQENPQVVADAVLRLAQMPAGTRSLRTVVSAFAQPLEALNQQQSQLQQGVLSGSVYQDWI
jgi:NAD(P)-dependent dehydrogenase (short-subunit alcohol dehydrogenase family)